MATALALAVVVGGCGDDGDDAAGDEPPAEAPTTTTTQPPATDTEGALAVVQELADQKDWLMAELYKEPTLLDDPDNDYFEQYAELYTDEAEAPGSVEEFVRTLIDRGHVALAGPSGIFSETYVYEPEADGEDVLTFVYCMVSDRLAWEADYETGDDDLGGAAVMERGTGEARRVNGVWRLYAWEHFAEPSPLDPETLEPGRCEATSDVPDVDELLAELEGQDQ